MSLNWRRVTSTEPKKVEEQVGVAFVAILFGVVVGLIVSEIAGELRVWFDPGGQLRPPRLSHLIVGMFLTVLSFLGYFASRNRPQHRIYFFNWPLSLFLLDVAMVFDYYVVFQFAESPSSAGTVLRADARPEAILTAIAFLLYVLWDIVSWRISADKQYQKVISRKPDASFGARRKVSVTFFVLFSIGAGIICWCDPQSAKSVVILDVLLIAGLLAYRVAKPALDPGVATRVF